MLSRPIQLTMIFGFVKVSLRLGNQTVGANPPFLNQTSDAPPECTRVVNAAIGDHSRDAAKQLDVLQRIPVQPASILSR